MMQKLNINSWMKMMGSILVYGMIYLLSVLCLSLNAEEKALCKMLLRKFSHRGEG